MTDKERRIGILGGTFDPIHIGHLILAEQAYGEFALDKVLFIPSGVSYFKKDQGVTPARDRYAMAALAIEGNPHFAISDMEIRRGGHSYTADTVLSLRRQEENARLFFIIGADILPQMAHWRTPEVIFENCCILAAMRGTLHAQQLEENARSCREAFRADVRLLHGPNLEISSSRIRALAQERRSVRYYVPEAVRSYILEHRLYAPAGKTGEEEGE